MCAIRGRKDKYSFISLVIEKLSLKYFAEVKHKYQRISLTSFLRTILVDNIKYYRDNDKVNNNNANISRKCKTEIKNC